MMNNIKGLRATNRRDAMAGNNVLAVGRIKNRNEVMREQGQVVEVVTKASTRVNNKETIDTSMFAKIRANKESYNKQLEDLAYDRWLDEQYEQQARERKISYKVSSVFKAIARDLVSGL